MVSKEDYMLWRDNYVTRAFMDACRERIEDAKDMLSVEAGLDQNQDNFYRGFIRAYREIEQFRPDDEE